MNKKFGIILMIGILLTGAFSFAACEAPFNPHIHSWSKWETTLEPTCERDGEETRFCDQHNQKRPIPMLGHDWESIGLDLEIDGGLTGISVKFCNRCETVDSKDLEQGGYITDDSFASIELYGDNLFTFIISNLSSVRTGTYTVEGNLLTLHYWDNYKFYFEITDMQIIFIGANDGLLSFFIPIGKIFNLYEKLAE